MSAKRTPIEQFLPAYMKAAKEGMTKEAFAEQIGVKPSTVYQRVYEIRKNGHPEVPLLRSEGVKSLKERIDAILGDAKPEAKAPKQKAKAKAEPKVEEPKLVADDEADAEEQTLSEIFG
jgi:hypothetical protein